MTETPHGKPAPPEHPPAITAPARERADRIGPEDTDGDAEGPYPDPDEYADPDAPEH